MLPGQTRLLLQNIRHWVAAETANLPDAMMLDHHMRGESAALPAILQRHGPMVLNVCRRHLRQPQDADDAFQATFLVFLRRAGAIGKRESLGAWLHTVACRVSQRARAHARRPEPERTTQPAVEPSGLAP